MCRVNDCSLRIARLNIARELNADLPSHLSVPRELRRAAQVIPSPPLTDCLWSTIDWYWLTAAHATRKLSRLSPPKGERGEALGAV